MASTVPGPTPAIVAALIGAEVRTVEQLSGGASSATYSVDAIRDDAPWPLILQCAATGSVPPGGLPRADQAQLQQFAFANGLPVAEVVRVLVPEDGLGEGYVMTRLPGEALAPRWLKLPDYAPARAVLTRQCADVLARLHQLPMAGVAGLALPTGSTAELLDRMFANYRRFAVSSPIFDLIFAWLKERIVDRPASSIVHGDFRSGNFLVAPDGLVAVLDWELAHLGDPHEDLGWLCCNSWRFGVWDKPVGGFGERDELHAAYEAAGGDPVDKGRAHWWEVLGTLKWGLSCLTLGDDHVSGRLRNVERAAIGRRVSEVELDLMHMLKFGSV
ncbi:phosphotransferase family protein [Sandarakinorhabdus sp. AAP62]|uniref:phosphotransferase family protein n=1 Tax=Sandarakinorhabdus sp. AAP62 TaxID=1248916 RepID=UPI00037A7CD0|nr:phosphotransferase family protein [Sandarakinorhabdus sp. AAP62]